MKKKKKISSLENDVAKLENKNESITKENNKIKSENKKLSDKMSLFEEEKINLINNLNDKEMEYSSNKKKVVDLTKQLEDFKSILNQKVEEVEKLKINITKLQSNLNLANLELKQKEENLKQYEEKYHILKNEAINGGNNTSSNHNDTNNELINIMDKHTQLFQEKSNLEKELNIIKENNNQLRQDLLKSIKENDSLQNKIKLLSEENLNINETYNQINNKYQELKKIISDKDKEINNYKEINTALIEKQKNKFEQENKVDPKNYVIITEKKYKKLTWYLVCKKKNNQKNNSEPKDINNQNIINEKDNFNENNYNNYRWVSGLVLKRDQLAKFNQFNNDEQKMKEMQDFVFDLQKKLENKQDIISRLDYKNKKLQDQLHNKTANIKGLLKGNLMADISKNTLNDQKMNNSALTTQLQSENLKLKNELSKLKEEKKAKEVFDNQTKDIINIEKDYSGFLDEDPKDNNEDGMINFLKSDVIDEAMSRKSGMPGPLIKSQISSLNEYRESERKVDEYLSKGIKDETNDKEVIKLMQEQNKFLKEQIKEINNKYNLLAEQVKELLKNIKCDMKIKPQVSQICQIFGYSPEIINQVVANNKKVIK